MFPSINAFQIFKWLSAQPISAGAICKANLKGCFFCGVNWTPRNRDGVTKPASVNLPRVVSHRSTSVSRETTFARWAKSNMETVPNTENSLTVLSQEWLMPLLWEHCNIDWIRNRLSTIWNTGGSDFNWRKIIGSWTSLECNDALGKLLVLEYTTSFLTLMLRRRERTSSRWHMASIRSRSLIRIWTWRSVSPKKLMLSPSFGVTIWSKWGVDGAQYTAARKSSKRHTLVGIWHWQLPHEWLLKIPFTTKAHGVPLSPSYNKMQPLIRDWRVQFWMPWPPSMNHWIPCLTVIKDTYMHWFAPTPPAFLHCYRRLIKTNRCTRSQCGECVVYTGYKYVFTTRYHYSMAPCSLSHTLWAPSHIRRSVSLGHSGTGIEYTVRLSWFVKIVIAWSNQKYRI